MGLLSLTSPFDVSRPDLFSLNRWIDNSTPQTWRMSAAEMGPPPLQATATSAQHANGAATPMPMQHLSASLRMSASRPAPFSQLLRHFDHSKSAATHIATYMPNLNDPLR